MASTVFLKLIAILQIVSKTSGVLDVTCFSPNPRININGDDGAFIRGFKSGGDQEASISFGRTLDTGTGNGLPTGSYIGISSRLYMPSAGGVGRVGAFYCQADKNGATERINTIIMAENSDVTPQHISQTVSIGESVTFTMDTTKSALRWWHNNVQYNGIGNRPNWDDVTSVTIPSVTVDDAGFYECHEAGKRTNGQHAIFQLIVRACETDRWGVSCQFTCSRCYNGGICDERSGECICAPGFSGVFCQIVHGRNKLGQDGQLRCSGTDDHTYGCQGVLLCLPHPYGCSCAAGFKGIDCNEECEDDFYGANCRSECHCADGVTCLKDTGECAGGQCHPDWYGVNCQELQLVVSNLQVAATENSVSIQWDSAPDPCHAVEYKVEYELTNRDQCLELTNEPTQLLSYTSASQATISDLEYYSTYTISVTARHSRLITEGTASTATIITEQTGESKSNDIYDNITKIIGTFHI
ncbi:uncharacterized protein [Amphiura filiformis]|uniref:uncharacterized protein n=1 Tax=Amphiura filiformis TaxID=82378 RepID=UPI003B220322